MSFSSREESRALARPVYLAFVRYGANPEAFFAYTTSEYPVVFDGVTYQPVAIQVPERTSSGDLDKSTIEVQVARDLPLAEIFRVTPPSYVVALTLRQGHVDGTEFPVIWVGRILGATRKGSIANLICEPTSTSLKRIALRRNYMYSCPHTLYGPQCRANKAAATLAATVESITGSRVTLPVGWDTPERAPKYLGGVAEWDGDAGPVVRGIVGLTDNRTFQLSGSTEELSVGQSIRLSLGCSHNFEIVGGQPVSDCQDLHNNIHNFGGHPFIPTDNPIGTRLNLYY